MDPTIHTTVLPHDDAEASLRSHRDTLGLEVRHDVGSGPAFRDRAGNLVRIQEVR